MLLTVLSIGGTILGATTIAGLLMLYQIRGATDFANSAKAIFAADAGTEWALYSYFNPASTLTMPSFANGALSSVTCYDDAGVALDSCGAIGAATSSFASYAVARGASFNTKRAFFVGFGSLSGPTP
jgi:hypothetical protein